MALSVCLPLSTDRLGREMAIHGTALFPVACYHDDLEKMEVPWHWHEELEVLTVTQGTVRVCVSGSEYIVRQGEGAFINTGILHGAWAISGGECRLHSIVFHPRLVGGSADSIFWQKYLEPLLNDPCRGCVLFAQAPWEQEAIRAIECAWQACVAEPPGFEFEAREQLSKIICLLSHHTMAAPKRPTAKGLRDGARMKTMLQYIQDHLGEALTLPDIAQSANISPNECLRCFRNVVGSSPIQYIRLLRLQKAAGLLSATEQSISDIAAQCGFQELSYFSKIFRTWKGCTPREYRQQQRGNS